MARTLKGWLPRSLYNRMYIPMGIFPWANWP